MKLIVIAGFLGSGKTTLILSVATILAHQRRLKVAIIENEIGEIGIDNQYLEMEGLKVKEIQSGCICCELSYDLLETIDKVKNSFNPDVIIIEPSGVANPERILEVLQHSKLDIHQKKVVVVIDANRFSAILALKLPFVQGSFRVADLVVINKIDGLKEGVLDTVTRAVKELAVHSKILPLSAIQGYGLNELMESIE